MARSLRSSAVVPAGVCVQDVRTEGLGTVITARSSSVEAACPDCKAPARWVHSRYVRTLADLPLGGRPVQLRLVVRRLRCESAACARRIFTERLKPAVPWARRTAHLDAVAHQLGLALGGRPGGRVRSTADDVGQQRHPLAPGPAARLAGLRAATGDGDRRLGLEAQPSLSHVDLRPGATVHHQPSA